MSKGMKQFQGDWFAAARARRLPHALVIFGLWPLLTALATALAIGEVPYSQFSSWQRIGLGLLAVTLWIPDFLWVGALAWGVSVALAALAAARGWLPLDASVRRRGAEPLVLFGAAFLGTAMWFPSTLRHPFLTPLFSGPSFLVLALVAAVVAFGATRLLVRSHQGRGLAALLLLGLAVPLPAALGGVSWRRSAPEPPLVLLGLDSLAMTSPLAPLEELARRRGGVWYRRAVSPGLITNAVWNSLLLGRPVHDHGVFFAGQPWPRKGERAPLLEAARAAGYHTVSMIPDQSSCGVGTTAGFDEDRSGPLGWRQVILPPAANASLLLPLVRPLLPRMPGSPAPPNLAGTFSYDLDRDLVAVLTAGDRGRRTLVAAHTAYLHMEAYPRTADLTGNELAILATAPLGHLKDRSFDWLDHDRPDDPIALHKWKHRRLLAAVVAAVQDTGFLDRGGRLALFSDHGDRAGITLDNFGDPSYFHVPLATFGLPARDPEQPISLLDLPALAGLTPDVPPAPPVVEYGMTRPEDWHRLIEHTRLRWSGAFETDPEVFAEALRDLRAFRPWPDPAPETTPAPP